MHLIVAVRRFGRNQFRHRRTGFNHRRFHVAVSAAAPPCVVTATIAPVSISTAFSAL
jgi:hypothetical protein